MYPVAAPRCENGDHSPTGRYLRFIASIGYTLSDVEEHAASDRIV